VILTVDASVFVAAARPAEAQSKESVAFLRQARAEAAALVCPTLVLPECAGAVARPTRDAATATEVRALIRRLRGLSLVSLALGLADRAADLAVAHRLRGSDAVYVAVAQAFGASLITWDEEMLERAPAVVPTMKPSDWLAQRALP